MSVWIMFCLGYFLAQECNPACLSKYIVRYSMYLLDVRIIYMQIHSFGGFLLSVSLGRLCNANLTFTVKSLLSWRIF